MTSNEHQLLADLKENFQDFKCTLQDLRNPTEEFVINFYSFFLQEFEADINNINQVIDFYHSRHFHAEASYQAYVKRYLVVSAFN